MRFSTLALAAAALTTALASPILQPGLIVDCVQHTSGLTASLTEFTDASSDFCNTAHSIQTNEVLTTGPTYCTSTRCIVLYLAFTGRDRSGSPTNGTLAYDDCMAYFSLRPFAFNTVHLYCASGWYGGSSNGKGTWAAEIVVTKPEEWDLRPTTTLPAFEDATKISGVSD